MIAALAVALALATAPQAPARAGTHHLTHSHPAPVIVALPHLIKAGPFPAPPPGVTVDCTSNCPLYLICESHSGTGNGHHCIAAFGTTDIINDVVVILSSASGAWLPILWKIIKNKIGQSTEEGEGTDQGGTDPQPPPPAMQRRPCLGGDVNPDGSNDRAYQTGNCLNNLDTSWYWSADSGSGNYDYINRHSLAEGRDDGIAYLSTRNGAYLYLKPDSQPGTWSTWSWFQAATCIKNC